MNCISKTAILFLTIFLNVGMAFAQQEDVLNKKVEVAFQNESIGHILKKIGKNSNVKFYYSDNKIPLHKKINLRIDGTLKDVLTEICRGSDLIFVVQGENVILKDKYENNDNQQFTLSGYLKDETSGEVLVGASIYLADSKLGTTSNNYGFYSITLPKGRFSMKVTYMGFAAKTIEVTLDKDETQNIELTPEYIEIGEAVVYPRLPNANVMDVAMSKENINIERIKSIPAIFGEIDVLKAISFIPGVQTAGEGTTGLFVRGGSSDQTLIQLDEAPIYNPSHLFGFFSVFNSDAIKDVDLYKGGIPAQYGGRLSSLVDIRMKEGNLKKLSGTGGIGLISSRLTLEAPIKKEKGSFILSGRRTYVDVINNLVTRISTGDKSPVKVFFYDMNLKANYRLNERNRLFISGYFGRDVLGVNKNFGINWGNYTATIRWNHEFSPKLFLNSTLLYSKYDYGINVDTGPQKFDWQSDLGELNNKIDFNYFFNPRNEFKFGYNVAAHRFSPAKVKFKASDGRFESRNLDTKYGMEHSFYASNTQRLTDKLSVEYGIRYSFFQNIGPGRVFQYENNRPEDRGGITDTVDYNRLEHIHLYHGPEPRVAARYAFTPSTSLKFSYTRMRQYLQVATNSTAGLPIDRWVASDKYIKPQIADQVALGLFKNFVENSFETSAEIYYKRMQNQIDFKEEAEILFNNYLESELRSGKAWAYGVELMVKKNVGKTTGWVSYTYSKTERRINGINNGKAYSPRYDRPHNLSTVISHQLSKRISLSANWVFTSGSAVSYPKGTYEVEGRIVNYYEGRNQDRMPNYHRMDFSVNIDGKKKRKWNGSWNLSIYNLYSRKNPFAIIFREVYNNNPLIDEDGTLEGEKVPITSVEQKPVKVYLFRLIPSITYNFKF